MENCFERDGARRYIYQISIEKDWRGKITRTLDALLKNGIEFDAFYYVTNQIVPSIDVVTDALFEAYGKPIHIYDLKWLSHRVNLNPGCVQAFNTFATANVHAITPVRQNYVVADLVKDPRVFVFLRHQWDTPEATPDIYARVVDALILFGLEGTDPDKNIFKTAEEIKQTIAASVTFKPQQFDELIAARLKALSSKPSRINFHSKVDGYCLPYETRLEITQKNLKDEALHQNFIASLERNLRKYLSDTDTRVRDCTQLIENLIHQLFYQQGLEFSEFVLGGGKNDVLQKDLPELVARVVDESPVVLKNKEAVKNGLVIALRDLVYNGTPEEKVYLSRLSNTYLMLFLLQCDPKLSIFFSTLAGRLQIYVCTSVIIPAISEYYLEPRNRRYWNLLKGAYLAGVKLFVNERIVDELVAHLRMVKKKYEELYQPCEDVFLSDELNTIYIDEILIRAYYYAKSRGRVQTFDNFLDAFVNPSLRHADTDLIEWLKHEFGIRYRANASLGITIDEKERDLIFESLKKRKHVEVKARTDTELILTIYALREKHNETDRSGIFGFSTWWLSTDTTTQVALNKALKNKHAVTCYIRPDFLYNYISLAPKKPEIDALYRELFPSMLGVNLSFHLPPDVIEVVQKNLRAHKDKNQARLSAVVRGFTERLKADPKLRGKQKLQHYFDQHIRDARSGT